MNIRIVFLFLLVAFSSLGQSDTNYYSKENGLNTEKEIKPLFALRCAPAHLSLSPLVNLGTYLGVEFSDYKKYFSFDAGITYNYFVQKSHRSSQLGIDLAHGHYSVKSEVGFSFIFKKEAFESVLKKDQNKLLKPIKHRRYEARIGLLYQERFIMNQGTFYRPIDSSYIFYHARFKPRDLMISIGAKARITNKKTKVINLANKSKSTESYIFFDVMFLIYNFEHDLFNYNLSDHDVHGFSPEKVWSPIKKIPAGARFGYQLSFLRRHSWYVRLEGGLYPGRVNVPTNALKGEISFGYQFMYKKS